MDILSMVLIVSGLVVFETITSIDNAIINAQVLSTMQSWARRWFLLWGLIPAVFLIRGLLPWLIVWSTVPALGPIGALTATFSGDPAVIMAVKRSAPILLIGGGTFLILLFLHWLFLEPKHFGLPGEQFMQSQSTWFFAFASILLTVLVWFAIQKDPMLGFSAVVGSSAFFISHGFREHAEKAEMDMIESRMSDWSKILYLEIIDASFSIDGVLGAFAFTLSVPLILIGNGIGALVVRQLTVSNVKRIQDYLYLKNGAMYSILILGIIMVYESFGYHVPIWISPFSTISVIGIFFLKSRAAMK